MPRSKTPSMETELKGLGRLAWRLGKRAWKLRDMKDYWDREERNRRQWGLPTLRARQVARLRRLIHYATEHIPFYRERFGRLGIRARDIRTLADLRHLPLLSKSDIRAGFPSSIVLPGRSFPVHMLGQTSGSTDEALCFVRPDERFHRSLYYAVLSRALGRTNERVFLLTTPAHTPGKGTGRQQPMLASKLGTLRPIRHLGGMEGLPVFAGNILAAPDEYFAELRETLAEAEPATLIANPVHLAALARYLRRTEARPPRLSSMITTYELLTDSTRRLVESVFDCVVSTQYGCSEINDIAVECEHGRLHVRMDQVIVEVVTDGRPTLPGELGRVVVTDLGNTNMPFIRYDLGDIASATSRPCACGRQGDCLEAIHGRADDLLYLAGRWITPLDIDRAFGFNPDLAAYQWLQRSPKKIDILLQPDRGAELDPARYRTAARRLLGPGMIVKCRLVDEIRPRASNKFRVLCPSDGSPRLEAQAPEGH